MTEGQKLVEYNRGYHDGELAMFQTVKPFFVNYMALLKSFTRIVENEDTTLNLLKQVHSIDKVMKEFG